MWERAALVVAFATACSGSAESSGTSQLQTSAIAPQCRSVPLPDPHEPLSGLVGGKAGEDACSGSYTQSSHTWGIECANGMCKCSYDGVEQCRCASVCPHVCCPPGDSP
jgi:hypothetical protein